MAEHPPECSGAEVRMAIDRFNETGPPALAGNGYRLNAHALFRLKRLIQLDDRVLVVGRLAVRPANGSAETKTLVLAWRFGADQRVSDIQTFGSEADAVSAVEGNGEGPG